MGYPSDGFGNLISAKRTAKAYIDREDVQPESKKMAEQVYAAAEGTLAPFDHAQTFGTFSFLLGYDSNVLLIPSDTANTASASGKSTVKSTVSAGYGYASSPLETIQYVPSLRFNLNKNFNGDSSTGEFADTTFSLYLTKDALAPVSYGLKTEGTLVFQNQTDTTGSKKYHLYNSVVQFAPYAKWDASKHWTYAAEIGFRMLSFTGEDTVTLAQRRSGSGITAKLTAQNRSSRKYFNPTYALRGELNSTDGTEYENTLFGAQLINTMKLGVTDFSQVLEVNRTSYGKSSTARADTFFVLSLLASKKIGPRWAMIYSADYSKNSSSDSATYGYNRFSLNAGVGYNF
jgi:hypothetical protein